MQPVNHPNNNPVPMPNLDEELDKADELLDEEEAKL